MAELIVFLAREERVAVAGERGAPTPCSVWSVEKRWQPILVRQVGMYKAGARSTFITSMQETKINQFCGFTASIATKRGTRLHHESQKINN